MVCGYGNKGREITKYLAGHGFSVVVMETKDTHIDMLKFAKISKNVVLFSTIEYATSDFENAGICSDNCRGTIIALDDDKMKMKITSRCKILNKSKKVITSAYSYKIRDNLQSFGVDLVVMPNRSFAHEIKLAIEEDYTLDIFRIISSESREGFVHQRPPLGSWVLCGDKAYTGEIRRKISGLGIDLKIFNAGKNKGESHHLETFYDGDLVTSTDIRNSKIDFEKVSTFVAMNNDDTSNLCAIFAVKKVNPDVFVITKVNSRENERLYNMLHVDIAFSSYKNVARTINFYITEPLTIDFIKEVKKMREEDVMALYKKMKEVNKCRGFDVWTISIPSDENVKLGYRSGDISSVMGVCTDSPLTALMVNRDGYENTVLPDESFVLSKGDKILFLGSHESKLKMNKYFELCH